MITPDEHIIIDWDYHTFDVADPECRVLFLYDSKESSRYVMVTGWLWCGGYIENVLYRQSGDRFRFEKVS